MNVRTIIVQMDLRLMSLLILMSGENLCRCILTLCKSTVLIVIDRGYSQQRLSNAIKVSLQSFTVTADWFGSSVAQSTASVFLSDDTTCEYGIQHVKLAKTVNNEADTSVTISHMSLHSPQTTLVSS